MEPKRELVGKVIWSKFVYDYTFTMDYGKKVKVTIDYHFDEIGDLEIVSRYPHAQRRAFATRILQNYEAEKFLTVDKSDITNPFARQLEKLFPRGIQVYWTVRPLDTALFVTGFSKFFNWNYRFKPFSTTVSRCLFKDNSMLRFSMISFFRKPELNPI